MEIGSAGLGEVGMNMTERLVRHDHQSVGLEILRRYEPIFKTLAPADGYDHVGRHGAGHYVKMVHNGIEYGLMQAYAEGFEAMHKSDYKFDLPKIANLWRQGSVVRSWLLELT